jgi:transcription termination factor Rho
MTEDTDMHGTAAATTDAAGTTTKPKRPPRRTAPARPRSGGDGDAKPAASRARKPRAKQEENEAGSREHDESQESRSQSEMQLDAPSEPIRDEFSSPTPEPTPAPVSVPVSEQTASVESESSTEVREPDRTESEYAGETEEQPATDRREPGGAPQDSQRPDEPRPEPVYGQGVIEISGKGFGFLRDFKRNYQQNPQDIFVTPEAVRRFALRDGMMVRGEVRRGGRGPQLSRLTEINGGPPERIKDLPLFEELTSVNPDKFVRLETVADRYTTRVIDLMTPIGRGQRGLIVAPPRTGKTTLLQHMAEAVVKSHPDLHLMLLLVDERPEEVTEFRHVLPTAEIWASSNDSDLKSHTRIAQLAIERAKRLVEDGQHVFMLLDSITRVGRAFNNAMANSGRTMSGGVDARALEIPRRLFAAARNTETAGSLTIIATALVETGSKMDELIFQEFKGTGNMELVLDRKISEQRTYPAVDIFKSGTRREELLLNDADLHKISVIRRGLSGHRPIEAIERLLFFLRKFPTNNQMLREIPG